MILTIFEYLRGKRQERAQRNAAKKGVHTCMFRRGDVVNLNIIPKCTICGAGLTSEGIPQ